MLSVDENHSRPIKHKDFDLSVKKITPKRFMWGLEKFLTSAHKLKRITNFNFTFKGFIYLIFKL